MAIAVINDEIRRNKNSPRRAGKILIFTQTKNQRSGLKNFPILKTQDKQTIKKAATTILRVLINN